MKNSLLIKMMVIMFAVQIMGTGTIKAEPVLSDKSFSNVAVTFMEWPEHEGDNTEQIRIVKDTSQVLRFDRRIIRVAISNPAVCDITTVGDKDVLVNSKIAGTANLLVWDEAESIATYSLSSTLNMEKLWRVLQGIDPNGKFNITPFNETVAVYGTATTSEKLKQIQDASKAFDKNVLCYAQLKESKQVMLEVRFAEVNRNANKDQKVDIDTVLSRFHEHRFLTGQTGATPASGDSTVTYGSNTREIFDRLSQTVGNLGGSYVSGTGYIGYAIKWLESKNLLKIIARPNLIAKDGEEATFVVGGELPISQSVASGGTTTVAVTYKEYGTKLKFTPTILSDDMMRLKTETEISEIDSSNIFTIGGSTVPSFLKRSNQTVAELRDNESLVIGGIITQRITKVNRKTPILGDIPVFKPLFNANEFQRQDVELLIVITPHVIKPMELGENKLYYEPNQVKEATRVYKPTSPDSNADLINGMIIQNETQRDINEDEAKAFSDVVAKRLAKRSGRTANAGLIAGPPLKSPQAKKLSTLTSEFPQNAPR